MAEWQGVTFKAHPGAKPTKGSTPAESWLWVLENELEEMALAGVLEYDPYKIDLSGSSRLQPEERRALLVAARSGDVRILQDACFYLLGEGD